MSLYDTLGITAKAAADEIKKAYRSAAQKLHPDRGGDEEKFKAVQKAYDVLGDAEKRARYDETGETSEGPTLRDKAVQALADLINQVIDALDRGEGNDVACNDPLSAARKEAHKALEDNAKQEKKLKRKVAQRQTALKRLKVKEGDGILCQILEGAIMQLEQNIERSLESSKLCRAVLDILAEYSYAADKKKPPSEGGFDDSDFSRVFGEYFGKR